ncbi:MAG: KpsF/GutQ family sugar-phosphate isomerase [Candidatus Omnitrophica bacterium]|nr:KpsF/GutQ family sugar-phosphate isomerase [Candidatus Omnitrophota bacterium]
MIETGRKVLMHEADAIRRMARKLDASFGKAVKLLARSCGAVVVIGMGKPSYIGQKISASLASTGTPSFALHPADALHGDIGRVSPGCAALILSNSGETDEILKLLPLLRAARCALVAVTGNPRSTLARESDVVLDTSVISEAEPLNAAPTASTTCMLAMGDALTMALVKSRGFKEIDFARLHPGGSLGRRLRLTVGDVMRRKNRHPMVRSDAPIREVLLRITSSHAGSATVVDARGRCIGIFTDGDLRRHFSELVKKPASPVARWMTPRPLTVREDLLAMKALEIFTRKKIDELPVVNASGRVTGLLDVQDLLEQGFMLPNE